MQLYKVYESTLISSIFSLKTWDAALKGLTIHSIFKYVVAPNVGRSSKKGLTMHSNFKYFCHPERACSSKENKASASGVPASPPIIRAMPCHAIPAGAAYDKGSYPFWPNLFSV